MLRKSGRAFPRIGSNRVLGVVDPYGDRIRYFRSNGEGPYGPLPKAQKSEKPKRRRLLPYISNWTLFRDDVLPVMFL